MSKYHLTLPTFRSTVPQSVGLGDVVKAITASMGIQMSATCGCETRAKKLNDWLTITWSPVVGGSTNEER